MRGKHQFLAGLTGACLMLALPVVCRANTITVNSLNDPTTTSGNGSCSLREAIDNANSTGTDTTGGDCALGSGDDTIVFSTGLTGTITIAATLPAIANTLTIQGPAANPPEIAVDGANEYQVMVVNPVATLNLNNLMIAHGFAITGGGINSDGTLTVTNSTFSDDSADGGVLFAGLGGGIYSEGTLTVTNSTFSGNNAQGSDHFGNPGGGIYSSGTATVTDSTFSDNSADEGGAIQAATLTVTNSTLSGNTSIFGGGAIGAQNLTVIGSAFSDNSTQGQGGAIFNAGILVSNSNFSDNSASFINAFGGGAIYSEDDASLVVGGSTFTGNSTQGGGGAIADADFTLSTTNANITNSTFSGNSAPNGDGGAIFVQGGIPTHTGGGASVTNSTFYSNSSLSGSAIVMTYDALAVTNSTFVGNSNASSGSTIVIPLLPNTGVSLKGTIFADSIGRNCDIAFGDAGYNLSDDDTCGFTQSTSANNVIDAALNLDPDGLQDNGGPTETVALESGSIAANAIPVASCQYVNVNPCTNPPTIASGSSGPLVCDQRGEPRPGSGESACAIGAFEPQTLTEFAEFDTGLIVFPNQFAAGGSFTLGADAVFNPPTQAVTMTISSAAFGPLAVTIPAGSFKLVKGQYKYSGAIAGVNYGVTIFAPVDGVYDFTFAAFGVDVTGITNPVSVTLQIGSNIGTDDKVAAAIL
jgi:CSLREA domain-containing protein